MWLLKLVKAIVGANFTLVSETSLKISTCPLSHWRSFNA